jgi:hypothetical protein
VLPAEGGADAPAAHPGFVREPLSARRAASSPGSTELNSGKDTAQRLHEREADAMMATIRRGSDIRHRRQLLSKFTA